MSGSAEVFGSTGWWEDGGVHRLLRAVNPKRMDYLRERCGPLAGRRVLDVGCGGGILTLALARDNAEATGIDTSAGALEAARSQAAKEMLPVEFIEADAASLAKRAEAKPWPLVVCMEMLEHVKDPAAEIAALGDLVSAGGDLVISTINRTLEARAAMVWTLENALGLLPRGSHDPDLFLRPDEVAGYCEDAGFLVRDIVGLNWSFFGKTFLFSHSRMPVNYFIHARKK